VNDRNLGAIVRHDPGTAQMIFGSLLALTQIVRSELDHWTMGRLARRIAPDLAAAAGDMVPANLAENCGLAAAEVQLVLEELVRRGGLVREGPKYRAPDAASLQRTIDDLSMAGGRA
jgi:hypothetical protein